MEVTQRTALKSHGDIDSSAKETYGKGKTLFRIGNGGAGATGLIKALAEDHLNTITSTSHGPNFSIDWVCNHSRNTQLALLHNYIDIALTYERDQEDLAEAEGWSKTAGCAFHDHFVLAGPVSDPADIRNTKTITQALTRIANSSSLFHSRADTSATMWKERHLWTISNLTPWGNLNHNNNWYKTSLYSPSEAIIAADKAGAYLVIDRSTLLRQVALQTIHNTTVFFEPQSSQDILMNSCFALLPTRPESTARADAARMFVDYVLSERGQRIVEGFGRVELGGFALFAGTREGFAKEGLRGGRPVGGEWVVG